MFKLKFDIILMLPIFCLTLFGCNDSRDTVQPNDRLPAHLVGVWASEDAVMEGSALFEGVAVYLGADGVGAIVGGPPAIGCQIIAKFESSNDTILYEMTENGKTVEKGKLLYDPDHRTLTLIQDTCVVLTRRFDELDDNTLTDLGLEEEN
ncbi:hypothetical protein STSP2_01723 [Anaerohalosphaera lusitana]|uniref:Lipocalin-like domain-containing protein n=1 Tax=Anaerohalosphaera lusitana TaxID=1936003 RepID=A0A1U9NL54_9BACT|nr:hypothetical protein [Anaerohalosphaera lusitana]AQT68555.1 hypothetical protein STSP2_01723 [Anaerohalosphaera lusitana]